MKTAFITGASSGIGRATAVALAKSGFQLVVAGRRRERLETLVQELAPTPVHILTFDVRDRAAVEAAVAELPAPFQHVDVLINNAGNAHGMAPVQEGDVADWEAMLDGNVKGLLYVSRAVLPRMGEGGFIVNLGSIAGYEAYANGNVYCASKAAVAMLTRTMRIDLLPRGIRVAEVAPGMVETEFSAVRFKGDEERATSVYKGVQPLQAQDIAELIQFIVTRPPHVQIAEAVIFPAAQAAAATVRRQP
ncbi:SDR family NAD(P)-dependent oxidoreductase [Hymenobacter sp. BRD67]|uniref:SDR family NAD(P)-dependent oxidoreductase n=1 Tax=Hymenobacter sp. BRD67 TaxID=2675877 RepID=UPI0015644E1E|nr:SDR family NAD(P)-dependent oxidoreductase [Hymenobacter sp. BRD67]QKG52641.1 SDR family NAD(P)-dependent oxidoreductase [Hymenobacter sp. BRD67]